MVFQPSWRDATRPIRLQLRPPPPRRATVAVLPSSLTTRTPSHGATACSPVRLFRIIFAVHAVLPIAQAAGASSVAEYRTAAFAAGGGRRAALRREADALVPTARDTTSAASPVGGPAVFSPDGTQGEVAKLAARIFSAATDLAKAIVEKDIKTDTIVIGNGATANQVVESLKNKIDKTTDTERNTTKSVGISDVPQPAAKPANRMNVSGSAFLVDGGTPASTNGVILVPYTNGLTPAKPHVQMLERAETKLPRNHGNRQNVWDLLIVIPSHASESDRRASVRSTWFKYLSSPRCLPCRNTSVEAFFAVGGEAFETQDLKRQVEAEIAQYGDIAILNNFSQKYFTDRAEKIRHSIKYAVEHYNFTLLLKVDTDSWVFLDRLLALLQRQEEFGNPNVSSLVYAGNFKDGARPVMDKRNKWYDPIYKTQVGMDNYPRHAKGAGYILGHQLCKRIVATNGLLDLPSEDVTVGLWLAPVVHKTVEIPISHTSICKCKNNAADKAKDSSIVIDHYVSKEAMHARWRSYSLLGDACTCPTWVTGSWSNCLHIVNGDEVDASTMNSCGEGERRRLVECSSHSRSENSCKLIDMPASQERCDVPCTITSAEQFRISDWSPCPQIGCVKEAVQTRSVECVEVDCSGPRPVSQRRCPACTWSKRSELDVEAKVTALEQAAVRLRASSLASDAQWLQAEASQYRNHVKAPCSPVLVNVNQCKLSGGANGGRGWGWIDTFPDAQNVDQCAASVLARDNCDQGQFLFKGPGLCYCLRDHTMDECSFQATGIATYTLDCQVDSSYGQKSIMSCSASSEQDSSSACANAFDGNMNTDWTTHGEGVGSWIKLQFGRLVQINMMKYANILGSEKCEFVRLLFSDETHLAVRLKNDAELGTFNFPTKATDLVNIIVESIYTTMDDGKNGAREIEFWNVQGGPEKIHITMPSEIHKPCGGCYIKTNYSAHGFPVWKQEAGEHWLYMGTNQHWYVGDTQEKEKNFHCTSGFVASKTTSAGLMPSDVVNWKASDGSGWQDDDHISVTTKCPEACADESAWVDSKYGSGTSSCNDILRNPSWCTDLEEYSAEARRACPLACGLCHLQLHVLDSIDAEAIKHASKFQNTTAERTKASKASAPPQAKMMFLGCFVWEQSADAGSWDDPYGLDKCMALTQSKNNSFFGVNHGGNFCVFFDTQPDTVGEDCKHNEDDRGRYQGFEANMAIYQIQAAKLGQLSSHEAPRGDNATTGTSSKKAQQQEENINDRRQNMAPVPTGHAIGYTDFLRNNRNKYVLGLLAGRRKVRTSRRALRSRRKSIGATTKANRKS